MSPCRVPEIYFGILHFIADRPPMSLVPHEVNPDPAGSWNSAEMIENVAQARMGNEPYGRTYAPVGTCYLMRLLIFTSNLSFCTI